jgi:hypothetical protein
MIGAILSENDMKGAILSDTGQAILFDKGRESYNLV